MEHCDKEAQAAHEVMTVIRRSVVVLSQTNFTCACHIWMWFLTGCELCSFASHTEILYSEYIAIVCHFAQWKPVKRKTCKKGKLG